MAKKKKTKVIPLLKPGNYIVKKSKNLPLHKCWINKSWKSGGKANLMISRKHSNQNITICHYLVDLYSLGIKDTHYQFNIYEEEFLNFVKSQSDEDFLIEIDYPTAHNIIYAALEYAEELGFKPHKDFEAVTEHFLEEDDENIELIDIECGLNGKPTFMSSDSDSEQLIQQTLKQLEKAVGPGNFEFIDGTGYFNNDIDEDDEYTEENEFFYHLPPTLQNTVRKSDLESLVDNTLQLFQSKDLEEQSNATLLTNYILGKLEEHSYIDEDWYFQLDDYFDQNEILKEGPKELYTEYNNQQSVFSQTSSIDDDLKKLSNQHDFEEDKVRILLDQNPNIPILHYYFFLTVTDNPKQQIDIIKKANKLFPDITLFKILKFTLNNSNKPKIIDIHELHQKFYGNNHQIHEIEALELMNCFFNITKKQNLVASLPYFESSILEYGLAEQFETKLLEKLFYHKLSVLLALQETLKTLDD
ncbi:MULTISPECIES: hypothetical protein [unclassified Lentimicrobium]|uniref:hypothetical protein n=1 Tax=unclassified Lentimicrobium TaxID=2677434 RepID=UPI001555D15F|nr:MULTISPECIES: hypothetical protein [unclassified Lentimicrobium]NPD44967.1 hypothetical protein [Lentimicrobium sp. S6]NPD83473.1 hypothetical protein [Lentimicrobium sp. L6]